jgi:hypothetical protein
MSAFHTPYPADVCHRAVISKSPKKRWIPADLVQTIAEYSGSVASLVSFRGVSSVWQAAVSDAVGFLNGRCWTELEEQSDGPLWMSLHLDRPTAVARFALLCLGHGLEFLAWRYVADQLDFPLQLLGENNTVLTTLVLEECGACEQTADVNRLQSCRALKQLDLSSSSVTNAGIRGLELIPTLEKLRLPDCAEITDVSSLQSCRALKQLFLANTNVTDAGIRGLELIPTLEELDFWGCKEITDVSCLQSCRALKHLGLGRTNVTDEGIRGLELIPTLEKLVLGSVSQWLGEVCKQITDVSCLRSCRALKQLFLARTDVTDDGIRGLELIPTLEVLQFWYCERITDVSCLQNCRALQALVLAFTKVTDAGIRGLELIPTLEELNLSGCTKVHDLRALRNRPGLQIVAPENTTSPL